MDTDRLNLSTVSRYGTELVATSRGGDFHSDVGPRSRGLTRVEIGCFVWFKMKEHDTKLETDCLPCVHQTVLFHNSLDRIIRTPN